MKTDGKVTFMEKKTIKKLIFEQFILAKKDDFSTRSFPTSFAKTTTATVYTKTNG
jgi:hypothetical protein